MNDLIIPINFQKAFPTITQGLQKAKTIFDSISSFEDIEKIFLKGAGLSPNTYRSYLQAIKQLYEFTDGLNPLQITPAHIEAFYDNLIKNKVDRNTIYIRIQGLKRFFKGIRRVIPFYTSPFEIMDDNLKEKLPKNKRLRVRRVLNVKEIRAILKYLKSIDTLRAKRNYAIVYMLVTSGLRPSEFLQLHWKDIENIKGKIFAYFIGWGGEPDEQEIYEPALRACTEYFKAQFKREPREDEYLFYNLPRYPGEKPRPLEYQTLYNHIKAIGKTLKELRILTGKIKFTPHLFRKTYAFLLREAGMRLDKIQTKTRHVDIHTLFKYYFNGVEPANNYLNTIFMKD